MYIKALVLLFLCSSAFAVTGNQVSYSSVNGISELCVVTDRIPGGDYSKKDIKKEQSYCQVDFNSPVVALCPKTWSTSPGTMVYDLSETNYSTDAYEQSKYCGGKSKAQGVSTLVKFKQTMNASKTSATFSNSSLLYYHFSRYFDTKVSVPVSVYREMDRVSHRERVSSVGVKKARGSMNKAAWNILYDSGKDPSKYKPTSELFTADREKIYGILIRGKGERYGTEINGTRASGWGVGQNNDFQKTPAYLALRADKPLMAAIKSGLLKASKDIKMKSDLAGVTDVQMVYWMRELIEITLLDYIFSQQDRVGNIDYLWYWTWLDANGKVKTEKEKRKEYKDLPRRKISQIPTPAHLAGLKAQIIQRTQLNDNDAGGRYAYANYTKKTGMLENLKHYSAKTYNRLLDLDEDLQGRGPIYSWLTTAMGLSSRQINQVVINTHLAANLLRAQCSQLKFDLDDVDKFIKNGPRLEQVNCLR